MEIRRLFKLLAGLALLFCSVLARGQQPAVATRHPEKVARAIAWLRAHQDAREATARPGNDGPAVAFIIRAGGGNPAEFPEWCGYTQAGANHAGGLPVPAGAGGSYNWFLPASERTFFLRATRGQLLAVQVGDVVGLYNLRKRRIAHIMRVVAIVPGARPGLSPRGFYTIAGNEGTYPKAGMHLNFYPAANIYAAANWSY